MIHHLQPQWRLFQGANVEEPGGYFILEHVIVHPLILRDTFCSTS